VPPKSESPHALIEPSVLREAKAPKVEADSGYTKIYSTWAAFAALKADGSVTAWGDSGSGGSDALHLPTPTS
jgi:hypothetical protein